MTHKKAPTPREPAAIQWTTEKRNVSALKAWDKNPRRFTEKGMADLEASLIRLGYIDPIAVNRDDTIIGGHARKQTLLKLGLRNPNFTGQGDGGPVA